jgi:hypothetical protein
MSWNGEEAGRCVTQATGGWTFATLAQVERSTR